MATPNQPPLPVVQPPSGEPPLVSPSPAPKPGWKTSEFWLATVASLVQTAYASGFVPDSSDAGWVKGLAFLAAALTSIGYSVSRGNAKKA